MRFVEASRIALLPLLIVLMPAALTSQVKPPDPARPGPQPAGAAGAPFKLEQITAPAGLDTESPQLTVEGDRAILSWLERHGEHAVLKFAERTATGWSPTRTVASGSDLLVNAADVPSVRALPDRSLVAAWLQTGSDPEGYSLRIARSADGGVTWSPPATPHRDDPKAQHGFTSIFPLAGGGFGLVWLDGRETAGMTLKSAEYNADGVRRREASVDDRVCECCPTSSAVTSEGPIVAFRDRSADEIRDIATSRLIGGKWTPPQPVHRDGWRIEGCPVNGPSVTARGAQVVVGWFTVQASAGRAYAAFSSDAGRTFGQPVRVDDGIAVGRLQVGLLPGGGAAISWIESMKLGSQLKVRRIDANGTRSSSLVVADAPGPAHPRMVSTPRELLLAWVEQTRGTTRIRTARAALPQDGSKF
jgi:hypothetical protein